METSEALSVSFKINIPIKIINEYFDGLTKVEKAKNKKNNLEGEDKCEELCKRSINKIGEIEEEEKEDFNEILLKSGESRENKEKYKEKLQGILRKYEENLEEIEQEIEEHRKEKEIIGDFLGSILGKEMFDKIDKLV